ncbi:MAG TPA: hypothetical protein VGC62_23775 [Pseudomonas sp.]|uniref:hypothetical protein n=1 Tax=Pseudomonas sp. TaxID=306 RepID=UPI002ED909AF
MKSNRCISSSIVLAALIFLAPYAKAAYPKNMAVSVDVWNNAKQDVSLTSASWFPAGTDLSQYVIPADYPNASFLITLNNSRNDFANFRLRSEGKECEFRIAHEVKFQWFSINPVPAKTASARSVGRVPAECSASVIKGAQSLAAYTVRVGMK